MGERGPIGNIIAAAVVLLMASACQPARAALLGDLTGDGRVGVDDALTELRIAVGLQTPTPYQLLVGDVFPLPQNGAPGGDGKITAADALTLIQYLVGLIDPVTFGNQTTRIAIIDANPQVVAPGGALMFHLGYAGLPPLNTVWSVVGGPANGTISSSGLYTAPATNTNLSVTIVAQAAGLTVMGGAFVTPDAPPPPPGSSP